MKKKVLKKALKFLTKRIINKYDPHVIAVTGSVGKTSTKDAVYETLRKYKKVRKSSGNLNTEFGAPLVFFKVDEPGKDLKGWLKILWKGIKLILKKDKNYPPIIVMEMAADRKGDIEYLTDFIKPHVGIVTAIGETPVHLENYDSVNEIVKEKSLLVKNTKKEGVALLNADDGRVFQMKGRSKAEVKTYGKSKRAELRAREIERIQDKDKPGGIKFKINHDTEEHEIKLPHVLDEGSVYAVLAAVAAGLSLSIPLYRLVESSKNFRPPKGRMRLLEGKEDSWIIDSSYNSAPLSTEMALNTLKELEAGRKIAVLGDMLELGEESEQAHREIGEKTGFLDILITVGEDSEFIGKESKLKEIHHFSNSEKASEKMAEIIEKGDLVLVKGSQSIRTEKVVESLMADPELAERLLVRQYPPWKNDK